MKHLNSNGQMTVEMVLIIVALFSVTLALSSSLKNTEFFQSFTSKPARMFRGMIESGVWAPPDLAVRNHPNQFSRVGSPEGVTDN